MPALIELSGIKRIFYLGDSEVRALRHLELRIDAGEYVAIMGPSGSGKSTLLNLLGLLDHPNTGQRIVIDTKFTSIVTSGWYREETLRSGYIYQIYAYLRSQEGRGDPLADFASGLLLHPAIGQMVDETVVIQGHPVRFATVDLTTTPAKIREQLLRFFEPTWLSSASNQ